MILSFRSGETESIWRGQECRRIPFDVQKLARRKLRMLNNAQNVEDLRVPPGNRLEALKGDRKGQYSIRVNDRWRICFVWSAAGAAQVELVDYH